MEIFAPEDTNPAEILKKRPYQVWTFGPRLLKDGEPLPDSYFTGQSRAAHPRTAIGYYEPGHYCFVVVDGRQAGHSKGITLADFSQLMYSFGCKEAYNLDGGGTSTMWFDGEIINVPSSGQADGRSCSDILFLREFDSYASEIAQSAN